MATFSKSGFKTLNYELFRPHYPPSFYKHLANYVKGPVKKTADLGCGTGVATFDLLNISDTVVGVDLSPSMVNTSNSLVEERCEAMDVDPKRIRFEVGSLDHVDKFGQNEYNLLTGAQCLHWTKDFKKFYEDSAKVLTSNGVLAYWYYVDPVVVDFAGESKDKLAKLKKVKELYLKYMYNDPSLMGPHWEQPGRSLIKDNYKNINNQIPEGIFKDVVVSKYEVDLDNYKEPVESEDLVLVKKNVTLQDFFNYIDTYSGYHNFKEKNPDFDFIGEFARELQAEVGWDKDTKIDLVFNSGYTFLTKK